MTWLYNFDLFFWGLVIGWFLGSSAHHVYSKGGL